MDKLEKQCGPSICSDFLLKHCELRGVAQLGAGVSLNFTKARDKMVWCCLYSLFFFEELFR